MRNRRRLLLLTLVLVVLAVVGVVYATRGTRRIDDTPVRISVSDVAQFSIPTDIKLDLVEAPLTDEKPNPDHRCSISVSNDGAVVVSAHTGSSRRIKVWDATSGRVVRQSSDPTSGGDAALTRDGRTLYAGFQNVRDGGLPLGSTLRIWDTKTGKLLRQRNTNCWALSADSKTLATLDVHVDIDPMYYGRPHADPPRSILAVWDVATWKVRRAFVFGLSDPNAIALSPDGSTVALDIGGKIQVIDADTGSVLWRANSQTSSLTFSQDGKTLASAQIHPGAVPRRVDVSLWDVSTGVSRRLCSYNDNTRNWFDPVFTGMGFTSDGQTLLFGTRSLVVPVSVADKLPEVGLAIDEQNADFARRGLQPGDTKEITAFGLSGDGKTAVISGHFGDEWGIRVIDVATREVRFPPKKP